MRKVKAVLSLGLGILLLTMAATGILMYLNKGGMIWILPRYVVTGVHTWSSFVFAGAAVIHFLLNIRIFIAEWRSGRKKKQADSTEE